MSLGFRVGQSDFFMTFWCSERPALHTEREKERERERDKSRESNHKRHTEREREKDILRDY